MISFKSLCVLTLSMAFTGLSAQNLYDQSFRKWEDGPVIWNEFRVSYVRDDAKYVSLLACDILSEVEKIKVGNFRFPAIKTTTRMNKLASWYDPDRCTDWTLRYEQVRFDMLEVLRRQLQNSFNRNFMEDRLQDYYDQYITNTMQDFDRESNYGADTLVVLKYEEKYKSQMDTLTLIPVQIPEFTKKDWGVSINGGAGVEKYGSPVSNGVTPAIGFQYGFGAMYKKISFGLHGLLAWSDDLKCDNFYHDSKYDYNWTKGKSVSGGNIVLDAGYNVVDNSKITIVPLVGIGVTFIDQKTDIPRGNNKEAYENSEIDGFRAQAGLALDWKIRRSLNTYLYGADYTETKIRFAVNGARTNFKGIGPTYSLNASIVFYAESWNLK